MADEPLVHTVLKQRLPTALKEKDDPTEVSNCAYCEQQTYLRPVTMSSPLLFALRRIAEINHNAMRPAIAGDMAKCGRTVYCTYTQLKYWELITQSGKGWIVTELGETFLSGTLAVEAQLWVYSDEVREREDAPAFYVTTHEIKDYVPATTRDKVREEMVGLTNA